MRRERAPLAIGILAAAGAAFFILPLIGLVVRTPWADAARAVTSADTLEALRLSLVASLTATGVALVLGVPLAWVYARIEFPGRSVLRALTTLPMVLPPVVGGIALLLAFGRRGLLGSWLESSFGISLPFTTAGVVFAETFVAMPFLVLTVEAGLRSMDRRYEDAARTLGAKRWTIFTRVTLPLIAPSLFAGAVLCWARALGEFGATITFAGNFPGVTQTMPLAVYLLLGTNPEGSYILSLILLVVSLVVLVGLRHRWLGSA
ncbi:MAG: molybdate ABC transporter permease subunit [Chloroflexi bacterium]|nr:MAG: molybdate ABC transporter permease subunit [Chloroflexota bacterium]TME93317.1 MAG: molybdate ABC transporter permease subunit [Chloroflexota bacterium]